MHRCGTVLQRLGQKEAEPKQTRISLRQEKILAYLAETVTAGETYEGVFFKLVNSLDMGGGLHKFSPIGFFNEYADLENPGQMIDESK